MLNYQYILTKKDLFQTLTGFTYSQFIKLFPKFVYALRQTEYNRIPNEKRIRIPGGGRKSKLKTDKQKLFFILFYYIIIKFISFFSHSTMYRYSII